MPLSGSQSYEDKPGYISGTTTTPLPRLLLVTSRELMLPSFGIALESALSGGARLIQLREKDLPDTELRDLAAAAAVLCRQYGARLQVNARADIAQMVSAGLHLPANGLKPDKARGVLVDNELCGVSVHSIEEAERATEAGADYLVFGSVFETASHPGEKPAGPDALRQVVKSTSLPVYAIGGIDASRVAACREAGAYGVAVTSAVWNTPDPAQAVQELNAALG